jgi:hypothetical protein
MSHQKEAFGSGTPLYVDQTNNRVGVNNAAPATALDVTGTVNISNSSGATLKLTSTDTTGANTELLGQIDFVSSDTSTGSAGTQARIKGVYEDNGDSSGLAFLTGASTGSGSPTINEVMRIRHEGRVGIGVSDPSQDIDLVGSSNSGSGSVRAGGAGSGTQAAFIAQAQFGSASFGTYDNYPAVLNSSNNPMVYFNTNASGRAVFAEGITFNGDTAAANALDDYEEGTWTPTVDYGTVSSLSTWYTKIGNIVSVGGLIFNFSDRSNANQVVINNLPFTSGSTLSAGSVFFRHCNISGNQLSCYTPSTATSLQFWSSSFAGSYSELIHSQLNSSDARIFFQITYQT